MYPRSNFEGAHPGMQRTIIHRLVESQQWVTVYQYSLLDAAFAAVDSMVRMFVDILPCLQVK